MPDFNIDSALAAMTRREKIAQTMQYSLSKIDKSSEATIEKFFTQYPVGSLFAGLDVIAKWSSGDDPAAILKTCQKFCKTPLAVAGDLERGTKNLQLPEPLTLAASHDPALAYQYGKWIGRAGRSAGFTWSYSPECDIALNWMNPINNHRGMGDDPENIARLAGEIIRGMQEEKLSAAAKHFPGDGSDFRDQHTGISINRLSRERWMATYGEIYRKLIASGLHSIMVGHISLPFMDPGTPYPLPGTLSSKIMIDLLRKELGFEGVIVSDALVMGGFTRIQPYEKRIIQAFNAGIDVMLWPELDYIDVIDRAIECGEIPESRLDDAVRRILTMKMREGLFEKEKEVRPAPDAEVYKVQGSAFADEVAEKGIALIRNEENVLPFDRAKTKRVLLWFALTNPEKLEEKYKTLIDEIKARCDEVVIRSNGNCLELLELEKQGEVFDAVLFIFDVHIEITYPCRPRGSQAECLWTMLNTTKHHPVAVALNSPYLLMESPVLPTLVNAHSSGEAVFRTLPRLLWGEKPFTATSPVKFPDLLGVDPEL